MTSISTVMFPGNTTAPDGAARSDPQVVAPDVSEQFAAAVDNRRLLIKLGRAIHQAEHFHNTLYPVKTPQMGPQRGQDRQSGLPGRRIASGHVHFGPHAAR